MVFERSRSDLVFDIINIVFIVIIVIVMLYPLYFTVIASFSDPNETLLGHTFLWVKGFTIDAYKNVFRNEDIGLGYANSIFITSVGTIYALVVTIPCAYALSRKQLRGRGVFMGVFVFTMYFNGGLIPTYLVVQQIGLLDTRAVLILGAGFGVYNMIVTRTFYQHNFPIELYEAAKIDGCSEIRIFLQIALPLSGAIVAVIALYDAVAHWNSYFSALIYLSSKKKWPLQLILRNVLIMNQKLSMDTDALHNADLEQIQYAQRQAQMAETMKYSLIFISSIPMLAVYPFVQKYFVKGVMIGSLKG